MSANPDTGPWAVVTADIVDSAKIEGLQKIRDRALDELSHRHLREKRVLGRYTVTAWDEFQNVLASPTEIPDVVWDLRLAFRPVNDLKIGIGLGGIDELPGPKTPINEVSSGDAFLRAREALSRMKTDKYDLRTVVCSDEPSLDHDLNLIYMLVDSLLSNLSDRQWQTIIDYRETRNQEMAAQRRDVNVSTVSRTLQRGFFWQMVDARKDLRELIGRRLHLGVQEP